MKRAPDDARTVQHYPVQSRLSCDDFDFGAELMKKRGGLQRALPSSNHDNALPSEPA